MLYQRKKGGDTQVPFKALELEEDYSGPWLAWSPLELIPEPALTSACDVAMGRVVCCTKDMEM